MTTLWILHFHNDESGDDIYVFDTREKACAAFNDWVADVDEKYWQPTQDRGDQPDDKLGACIWMADETHDSWVYDDDLYIAIIRQELNFNFWRDVRARMQATMKEKE